MKCFIDGNQLCLVKDDFINLQESPIIFVEITGTNDDTLKMITNDICKMEGCLDWGDQGNNILSGCGKCSYCIAHQND